jgi:transposase
VIQAPELTGVIMSNLFWLTDAQLERLRPFFPKSHGRPRVDDRRVVSGIIFINRNGLRWCDAPKECGPAKTLYNRWGDKGIFARMMHGLAVEAAVPKTVMLDATYLIAHRTATSLRQTQGGSVGKTTALLEPLADAIGRHVLSAEAIFADDTPISMLAPGTGKTQTARLWTYARDERPWGGTAQPAAWCRFSGDRKRQHHKDHLARFRGWMHATSRGLQTNHCRAADGYAGFEDLYLSGAIREVACMAPSRQIALQSPDGQRMSDASSSTSSGRRAPPSLKKPSAGSPSYRLSKNRPEGRLQIAAPNCDAHMPPRSSTIWSDGWPCNSPRSQAYPHWPRPSDTP